MMFSELKFNIVNKLARQETIWMNNMTASTKNPYNFHEMKILPSSSASSFCPKVHDRLSIKVLKSEGFMNNLLPLGNSDRLETSSVRTLVNMKQKSLQRAPQLVKTMMPILIIWMLLRLVPIAAK